MELCNSCYASQRQVHPHRPDRALVCATPGCRNGFEGDVLHLVGSHVEDEPRRPVKVYETEVWERRKAFTGWEWVRR